MHGPRAFLDLQSTRQPVSPAMYKVFETIRRRIAGATRFAGDRSGVAAIEFAMVAPIVLFLFLGTLEMSQAITVDRRVTQVASSTADLVARTKQTTTSEMDGIMDLIDETMKPYDPNLMKVTLVNVAANPDDASDTRVCWVYNHNGGASTSATAGAAYTLPTGLVEAGDSVVIAEVQYDYQPLITNYFIKSTLALTEKFFLKPRLSTMVEFDGTICSFS